MLAEARGQIAGSVLEPRNGFDLMRVVLCVSIGRRKPDTSRPQNNRGSPAEFVLLGVVHALLSVGVAPVCTAAARLWSAGNGLATGKLWATETLPSSFSGAPKRGRGRGQLL